MDHPVNATFFWQSQNFSQLQILLLKSFFQIYSHMHLIITLYYVVVIDPEHYIIIANKSKLLLLSLFSSFARILKVSGLENNIYLAYQILSVEKNYYSFNFNKVPFVYL